MDNLGFPATAMVNLYWGNKGCAVKIATCQAKDAMREANEWIAQLYLEKWDGKLPTFMEQNGANIMITPDSLGG